MSWNNKVIWSEGMFLRPQHFQQFDRYVQNVISMRANASRIDAWGFQSLRLDEQALAMGKIVVAEATGIFPDGTAFSIPSQDGSPVALDIPDGLKNFDVYLSIPLMKSGRPEINRDDINEAMARYQQIPFELRDSVAGSVVDADIEVGSLASRLMLQGEERSDFACIAIARIIEKRSDESIVLDKQFIPTFSNCLHCTSLVGFVDEIYGLVRHRAEALAARICQSGQNSVAEIADFLLLQLTNRVSPVLLHMSKRAIHPEDLYTHFLMLAGELASFTQNDKLAQVYPLYKHHALAESFEPVMQSLRSSLSMVLEQNAVSIALVERKYGIRVGKINDPSLLDGASFILAVKAAVSNDKVRSELPKQIKIGSVEVIRDLVNKQIRGIAISPLAVAPRQIPYHVGFNYFELDTSSQYWEQLSHSGGIALHIAGEFPELELEMWAIRG